MNVAAIVERCLSLNHFVIRAPLQARLVHRTSETIYWELFHGRALDGTMTRLQATFQSWNLEVDPAAAEPLLSVKWDHVNQTLFVTRAILCHAHEVVHNNSNVIETRETMRWLRELVGQVNVNGHSEAELEEELRALIGHAVYGTSRLPLTSLETPLPQFLLGQLGYMLPGQAWRFRELELALRRADDLIGVNRVANPLQWGLADLQMLILNVSLSPYTCLVGNMLRWLRGQQHVGNISVLQRAEFLSWLMRLQWRHLNAYDLRTFHHRGANYPDALLIDEVLREMLTMIETERTDWTAAEAMKLRRGLRLGWFLRTMYAGQPVPERPTSPGENLRVMPFDRVPEEQILMVQHRRRQLFDQPLNLSQCAESVLKLALGEMHQPSELAELGTALVLDRPLGILKSPGEPDATPMLAHVVYSRQLALRNWESIVERLHDQLRMVVDDTLINRLKAIQPAGPTVRRLERTHRPGVVSIEDLLQTADDFHLVRTTRQSVREFLDNVELPNELIENVIRWRTVLPTATPAGEVLQVHNNSGENWLTLRVDAGAGYTTRRGIERTKLIVV